MYIHKMIYFYTENISKSDFFWNIVTRVKNKNTTLVNLFHLLLYLNVIAMWGLIRSFNDSG